MHKIFAKSYVFYEFPIRMNLYEWPTPKPAPKPTHHWGLDNSYKIVRISHLVKYVRIAVRLLWKNTSLSLRRHAHGTLVRRRQSEGLATRD